MLRIMAMLLVVCLMLGAIPTTTFAAEITEEVTEETTEEILRSTQGQVDSTTQNDEMINFEEEETEETIVEKSEKIEYVTMTTDVSAVEPKAAGGTISSVARINVQGSISVLLSLISKTKIVLCEVAVIRLSLTMKEPYSWYEIREPEPIRKV